MAIVTIGLMCPPVTVAVAEMRHEITIVLPMSIPAGIAERGQVDSVAAIKPVITFSDPEATPSMIWNRNTKSL